MSDDKKTNPTIPAFMSPEAIEAARPMFSPWYMCTCERIHHLSTCPRSKLPDEVLAAFTAGRSLLKHVYFLTPHSVDREALGRELYEHEPSISNNGAQIILWGILPNSIRQGYVARAGAIYAIGYAEAMSTIASFSAHGELPALEPQHTPTEDRFDGEVWRGRVLVDDDWVHVGVEMANGFAQPLFFAYGKWRRTAHEFGYKVMAAWALAQRAAGRSEGEAERAALIEQREAVRALLAAHDDETTTFAAERVMNERDEARGAVLHLTAEVAEAQEAADAMQARAILAEAKERRQ